MILERSKYFYLIKHGCQISGCRSNSTVCAMRRISRSLLTFLFMIMASGGKYYYFFSCEDAL